MGVLESFLKISMVMAVMLLGANVFIGAFGYELTGEAVETDVDVSTDINGISLTTIVQSATIPTDASMNLTYWDVIWKGLVNLIAGWQIIILKIFQSIDPTTSENLATVAIEDGPETFGLGLLALITFFQYGGLAYIVFTFIVILRGGGGAP